MIGPTKIKVVKKEILRGQEHLLRAKGRATKKICDIQPSFKGVLGNSAH